VSKYVNKKGRFFMDYFTLLSNYIKESGYSLARLSTELRNRGFGVDKAYLSRLKNGKVPPAKKELNLAIGEIIGRDGEELEIRASLEDAPENLKALLKDIDNIKSFLDQSFNSILEKIQPFQLLDSNDHTIYPILITKKFNLYNSKVFRKQIELLTTVEKWKLLLLLTKEATIYRNENADMGQFNIIYDFESTEMKMRFDRAFASYSSEVKELSYEKKQISLFENVKYEIAVPVLRYIFSEYAYEEQDLIETVVLDKRDLNFQDVFILEVTDNKLHNDGILEGDRVVVIKQDTTYTYKDLVVFTIKNNPAIIARLQEYQDKYIIRFNDPYQKVRIVDANKINILGKVWQVNSFRRIKHYVFNN
jgi:SOS-response transcriptional repressor LexA